MSAFFLSAQHSTQVACDNWHFKTPPTLIKHNLNFIVVQEFCKGCVSKILSLGKASASIYPSLSHIELLETNNH